MAQHTAQQNAEGSRNLSTLVDASAELQHLVQTIWRLRQPDGCPWDREQTHQSIGKNMIEEAYEALDCIEADDVAHLREELGDVLMQVVLHAQIAADAGEFTLADVARDIDAKLIRRHPHVFGDVKAENTDDALASWDAAKLKEKGMKKVSQSMVSIPRELPALMRAQKVQHKAAKQGFDWPDCSGAMDKLDEEINELKIALDQGEPTSIADEFGDVLFSCVNIARFIGVDSEEALTAATDKFLSRYVLVEQLAAERGMEMKSSSLQALDALWDEAKQILSDQSEMEEM